MDNEIDRDILIRLDTKVGRMHDELFGNGQPGKLQNIEDKIDDNHDKIDVRVKSLEDTRLTTKGWVAGVVAAFGTAWGALEWMFHHGGRPPAH